MHPPQDNPPFDELQRLSHDILLGLRSKSYAVLVVRRAVPVQKIDFYKSGAPMQLAG